MSFQLDVVYRDIKLENILLDANGHIVITDFGLSKVLKNGARARSFCGTIEYMVSLKSSTKNLHLIFHCSQAPEIVGQNHDGYDRSVDFWSIGVLTLELFTGLSPFSVADDGVEDSQELISEKILNAKPHIPSSVSLKGHFVKFSLIKIPIRSAPLQKTS